MNWLRSSKTKSLQITKLSIENKNEELCDSTSKSIINPVLDKVSDEVPRYKKSKTKHISLDIKSIKASSSLFAYKSVEQNSSSKQSIISKFRISTLYTDKVSAVKTVSSKRKSENENKLTTELKIFRQSQYYDKPLPLAPLSDSRLPMILPMSPLSIHDKDYDLEDDIKELDLKNDSNEIPDYGIQYDEKIEKLFTPTTNESIGKQEQIAIKKPSIELFVCSTIHTGVTKPKDDHSLQDVDLKKKSNDIQHDISRRPFSADNSNVRIKNSLRSLDINLAKAQRLSLSNIINDNNLKQKSNQKISKTGQAAIKLQPLYDPGFNNVTLDTFGERFSKARLMYRHTVQEKHEQIINKLQIFDPIPRVSISPKNALADQKKIPNY